MAVKRPSAGSRRTSPAPWTCWRQRHRSGARRGTATAAMNKRKIVVFGPSLEAVSGVSTHVRMLLASDLARDFELLHFQVGSEGRRENALQKLMRFILSPLRLALFLLRTGADAVHLNTSLDAKAYWRDVVYSIVASLLGRRVVNQIHGGGIPPGFFCGGGFFSRVPAPLFFSRVSGGRTFSAR